MLYEHKPHCTANLDTGTSPATRRGLLHTAQCRLCSPDSNHSPGISITCLSDFDRSTSGLSRPQSHLPRDLSPHNLRSCPPCHLHRHLQNKTQCPSPWSQPLPPLELITSPTTYHQTQWLRRQASPRMSFHRRPKIPSSVSCVPTELTKARTRLIWYVSHTTNSHSNHLGLTGIRELAPTVTTTQSLGFFPS